MDIQMERVTIICDSCQRTVIEVKPAGLTPDDTERAEMEAAVEAHKQAKPTQPHVLRATVDAVA